jgi:hypothetical protein
MNEMKKIINQKLSKMANRFLLLALLCIVSLNLTGQEKTKQTEVGLIFSNTSNFGLSLKKGSDKFNWRFNTLLINRISYEIPQDTSEMTTWGLGVGIGNEFIKKIRDNFEFRFGYDITYELNQEKVDKEDDNYVVNSTRITKYSPGFNFVIGLNYIFKENLILGAEILPFYSYNKIVKKTGIKVGSGFRQLDSEAQTGHSWGLSNQGCQDYCCLQVLKG